MDSTPVPKTRRMEHEPGKTYTRQEKEVAETIARTFDCEKNRFANQLNPNKPAARRRDDWTGSDRNPKNGRNGVSVAPDETDRFNFLLKVARMCIARRADPAEFVRRQFAVLPPGSRLPYINILGSPQAWLNYSSVKLTAELKNSLTVALQINNSAFHSAAFSLSMSPLGLTSEQVWARVLADRSTDMSALFRYCMARSVAGTETTADKARFADIAVSFETEAFAQYMAMPRLYREAWGNFIPTDFIKAADNNEGASNG